MIVNGKEYNIDELTKDMNFETKMLKIRDNGLLLSDEQIEILKRYDIDYLKFSNLEALIYEIESYLNDEELDDLEWLSRELAERNYYQNTNK